MPSDRKWIPVGSIISGTELVILASVLKIKVYLFLGSTGILRKWVLSKVDAFVPVAFTKLPIFNFDPSLRVIALIFFEPKAISVTSFLMNSTPFSAAFFFHQLKMVFESKYP